MIVISLVSEDLLAEVGGKFIRRHRLRKVEALRLVAVEHAQAIERARILDAFGLDSTHKIVLHLGGVYGCELSNQVQHLSRKDLIGSFPAQTLTRTAVQVVKKFV